MKRLKIWASLLAAIAIGYLLVVLSIGAGRNDGPREVIAGRPILAAPGIVLETPEVALPAPDLAELRRIESRCVELVPKLRPAVVGVMSPSKAARRRPGKYAGGGSGVIISADGLVLSQWHVSHMRAGAKDFSEPHHMPGEEATVFLADGRECKAQLLGADLDCDLSLLQLPGPGPYPFVPLPSDAKVRTGDWLVKLGHPLGFRKDRPAPLRIGRVVLSSPGAFASDCPIVAGDSGGPFFDLEGHLVGILCANDAGVFCHYNKIPVGGRGSSWIDFTTTTEVWTAVATPQIAARADSMKKGDIHPQASRLYTLALATADRLAAEDLADGKRMKDAFDSATFKAATGPLRGGVASILNGDVAVGLATVVDEDGLAVTMASALPPRPRCRLPDGSITDFTVIGVDKAYDLAVIRIPPKSIRALPWADRDSLPAGTLVAAVGPDAAAANVGVVSVAPRKLADARTPTYELPLRVKADRPGIYGEPSKDGNGYTVGTTSALEKAAGIRARDRLVSIAGRPIRGDEDIAEAVRDKLSDDLAAVVLVREDRTITAQLPLLPEVPSNASNATWRSDDYPAALEYSPPVPTTASGCPLVDLSGQVVAVTVGRTSNHAGWAIPANAVRKIVGDAKAGKLRTWPVR